MSKKNIVFLVFSLLKLGRLYEIKRERALKKNRRKLRDKNN